MPVDDALKTQVASLGVVAFIVAPNLQHWLFVPEWAALYPAARILVAPPALDEDVRDKLKPHLSQGRQCELLDPRRSQLGPLVEQRLLEGAPLNMNEVGRRSEEKPGGDITGASTGNQARSKGSSGCSQRWVA